MRALQQRLIELGYLDDVADGIFGAKTQYAVRLLQTDLAERGFSANGVATPELQDVLFNENLAAYDPYKPLSRGNSNLRVTILQERLRELGFLADAADGIYGERTQEAVALFETENGLLSDGVADSQMLRKLYASDARACQGYIYMEKGDTATASASSTSASRSCITLRARPAAPTTTPPSPPCAASRPRSA